MRSKGFPLLRRSNKGDQIVRVVVDTPTSISGKSKDLIKKLKDELELPNDSFCKIDL
jgi:DnaJ-class molecular chaperone with C-terminal Zn finger domain